MLVIDDVKKLAKMQEKLLEKSVNDREANLVKYKSTVSQIDEYVFSDLLSDLNQINEHNQTLESELQFLEQVKSSYNQLLEQQLGFKRVCELYGDDDLELSDLSQINIEYIENRINVINGYLINIKNLDNNKNKLQELNEKLIQEEKNRIFLNRKLLEMEDLLRSNFISAEGRSIIDGQLQYASIISEYEKLGYDFRKLLDNIDDLRTLLVSVNNEKIEVEEKLKTAEICFNSVPNSESKQILDEINKEYIKIRYRLTMLKILELLSNSYNDYDLFKEKREKLLDLIKYRLSCMEKLGIHVSIDPFARTKVNEQLDMILSMTDNSKNINKIKKEIASLSKRVEEMVSQNNNYMMEINTNEDLVLNTTSMNDIDISSVSLPVEDYVEEKKILDNQVVSVKVLPLQFGLGRARQKSNSVVKRVNEMINCVSLKEDNKNEILSPELVIVSQPMIKYDEIEEKQETIKTEDKNISSEVVTLEDKKVDNIFTPVNNSDIFVTVDPFVETPLFTDRADESLEVDTSDNSSDIFTFDELGVVDKNVEPEFKLEYTENKENIVDDKEEENLQLEYNDLEEKMPDAFWVTQEEKMSNSNDDVVLSFDEQINALLLDQDSAKTTKQNNKVMKLEKSSDIRNAA